MTGDFAVFRGCFSLPQTLEAFDGRRLVETPADLRDVFDGVRSHFSNLGVTFLERHCVEASFSNPDTVLATHESRLISGSTLVQRPYPVFSVLRRIDGDWKITHSKYAITGPLEHSVVFGGTGGGA